MNSAGTASGSFSGSLVLRDFLGCDEIGLGNISLSYGSGSGSYLFAGNVSASLCSALSADFGVQYGSGGGRVCHLICLDGCFEDLCLSVP